MFTYGKVCAAIDIIISILQHLMAISDYIKSIFEKNHLNADTLWDYN